MNWCNLITYAELSIAPPRILWTTFSEKVLATCFRSLLTCWCHTKTFFDSLSVAVTLPLGLIEGTQFSTRFSLVKHQPFAFDFTYSQVNFLYSVSDSTEWIFSPPINCLHDISFILRRVFLVQSFCVFSTPMFGSMDVFPKLIFLLWVFLYPKSFWNSITFSLTTAPNCHLASRLKLTTQS